MENVSKIVKNLKIKATKAAYSPILFDLYNHLPDAKKQPSLLSVEMKIAEIMEESSYLVAITSSDGYFLCVNSAWTREFGWSFEELTESTFLSFVHSDDIKNTVKAVEDVAFLNADISKYEGFTNRYMVKDGGYKEVVWRVNKFDLNKKIFASIARVKE